MKILVLAFVAQTRVCAECRIVGGSQWHASTDPLFVEASSGV